MQFRLHHSLRRTLRKFRANPRCEIRVDHDFSAVIHACACTPREGQNGTWILPRMVAAYEAFHAAGHAHSVETWVDGRLVGPADEGRLVGPRECLWLAREGQRWVRFLGPATLEEGQAVRLDDGS